MLEQWEGTVLGLLRRSKLMGTALGQLKSLKRLATAYVRVRAQTGLRGTIVLWRSSE